jgi:hypothetical protein
LDVLCYCVGGAIYFLANSMQENIKPVNGIADIRAPRRNVAEDMLKIQTHT